MQRFPAAWAGAAVVAKIALLLLVTPFNFFGDPQPSGV
jgi:hypothetical protein